MTDIEKAANIIQKGGLVAFPTETVYGLGADATNQQACLAIFQAKGRPSNNPLIVHVASVEDACKLAYFNDDAERIARLLWPGPLTLVLPRKENSLIADCVTAGLATIALRVPADPVALELIVASKRPIAAPSANKSGKLSPTNSCHVKKNFGDKIFTLSAATKTLYGLESTILDLSAEVPAVLRLGFFTPDTLATLLAKEVVLASKLSKIKAPGMLLKHYAPKTKLRLNATALGKGEVGLNFGDSTLNANGSLNLSVNKNLLEAAANLYDYLHILDEFCQANTINTIAVAPIPKEEIGLAINDRLTRAAE
ncbi:MAG: L-threonylcarbamoyladenylate synthase [Rickettsiaceae bacterium]